MQLFEAIDVWRRISETRLVRYRCFRELSSGRYSVQSADFYRVPLDSELAIESDKQYIELLAEQAPAERSHLFDSLEAAIKAHDDEFSSEAPE